MTTTPQLEKQLQELETKVSFQELAIEDLNQAIIDQQFFMDKLQIQIRHLAQKISEAQPSNIVSQAEETPPPHY